MVRSAILRAGPTDYGCRRLQVEASASLCAHPTPWDDHGTGKLARLQPDLSGHTVLGRLCEHGRSRQGAQVKAGARFVSVLSSPVWHVSFRAPKDACPRTGPCSSWPVEQSSELRRPGLHQEHPSTAPEHLSGDRQPSAVRGTCNRSSRPQRSRLARHCSPPPNGAAHPPTEGRDRQPAQRLRPASGECPRMPGHMAHAWCRGASRGGYESDGLTGKRLGKPGGSFGQSRVILVGVYQRSARVAGESCHAYGDFGRRGP